MTLSLLSLSGANVMSIINSAFFLLGGITVFMLGMHLMGNNLEKAAGKSMRSLMSKTAKNRFAGVGTGAVVTAIVNSSSATTVMIVGFVNVGLMTLSQAASIIMGANIGTTISAFIMALSTEGGSAFSISAIFSLVSFAGLIVTMVAKKDTVKRVGYILQGVGLIFIGLNVMSGAVSGLTAEYIIKDGVAVKNPIAEAIKNVFISLGNNKQTLTWEIPVLFLIGAVLTAAMQASAALTAIVISLASSGLISLQMAMCIILGTNVGTCFTAILSSMGTNVNAKRTAVVHLLFNVAACVIFIFPVAFAGKYIAEFLSKFIPNTQWQIAIFHMIFNLATTLILLPFIKLLVKLACLIIPDKKGEAKGVQDAHACEGLDLRLLKTPPIAVGQSRQELVKMGQLAFSNYKLALDMLLSGDMSHKNDFASCEENINKLNKYITSFLVKLASEEITENDEKKVSSFYHVASDIERIGDYAENITEYAEYMSSNGFKFSDHAKEEIRMMDLHLTELWKYVEIVFSDRNLHYVADVEREEAETDRMKETMNEAHLRRMNENRCTAEVGAVYLQLASNMERIGDHMHNIANSVKDYVPLSEAA